MQYFAQIVDGLVVNVVVADQSWCNMVGGMWVEYTNTGDDIAGIGDQYDATTGTFIKPVII